MRGLKFARKAFLVLFFLTAFAFSLAHDAAAAGPGDFEKYRQTI